MPKGKYRLAWGHIALSVPNFEGDTITLGEVGEFTVITPSMDGRFFDPGHLVAMLHADRSVGIGHDVTLDVVGPDGALLFQNMPVVAKFQDIAPAAPLFCRVSVDLTNLCLMGEGTFIFRLAVDGQQVEGVKYTNLRWHPKTPPEP